MTAYSIKYQIQGRVKTIGASLQHNTAQLRMLLDGCRDIQISVRLANEFLVLIDPELRGITSRLIRRARIDMRKACAAINRNTFVAGYEHIPPLPIKKTKPRSTSRAARTAAADTDSGGGGPDDPDPDPDPERPYIALGIDHKAATPAAPPSNGPANREKGNMRS